MQYTKIHKMSLKYTIGRYRYPSRKIQEDIQITVVCTTLEICKYHLLCMNHWRNKNRFSLSNHHHSPPHIYNEYYYQSTKASLTKLLRMKSRVTDSLAKHGWSQKILASRILDATINLMALIVHHSVSAHRISNDQPAPYTAYLVFQLFISEHYLISACLGPVNIMFRMMKGPFYAPTIRLIEKHPEQFLTN